MSEKSKWFDPKAAHSLYEVRLHSASGVSIDECIGFLRAVKRLYLRGRISADTRKLFDQLGRLHPVHRLARNLTVLLKILADRTVEDVIHEGLTKAEYRALLDLERANATAKAKAVAQGLLNIYERTRMTEVARQLFREERTRRWEIPKEAD